MTYWNDKDVGPAIEEIAAAKGPFGLAVVLIAAVVVALATLAQWIFN